jgi:FMN-dependent NADH-azoreductase
MTKILRINSSSRLQGSHSRDLADIWQNNWLKHHPNDEVIIRELVETTIPHISDLTIAGFFTPKEQHTEEMEAATTLSDRLIEELLTADILLLSVPMYNFSIPSALKAYIDQIVRVGYTFSFDEQKGIYGLIENKQAFVTTAYGATGYFDGELRSLNFLEPYLKALLGFLGFSKITFFSIEGTSTDPATFEKSKQRSIAEIEYSISQI